MLLDPELRAAWSAQSKDAHNSVVGAMALCDEAGSTKEHDRALSMGEEWAKVMQACLVAWAATNKDDYAATIQKFFTAMIDDLEIIGDGKGGDKAVSRDDGFPMRMLGPYTALAYDWLHDKFPEELRARARQRWKAWIAWYVQKGYRARGPGTNYQAGFLIGTTLIAIAQGSEGGADSAELWKFVADELWGKDMAPLFAPGGYLDGGDWPEGWQYGPLSVAEYSLVTRIGKKHGLPMTGVSQWLTSLMRRHVYALSPSDRNYAGGDTEDEEPNLKPNVLTLDAIALGDTTADDRKWARGELSRLKISDRSWLLYDALAGVGDRPTLAPRAQWPTWYVTNATGTMFARTRWDDQAIWFVSTCAKMLDVDHHHNDAGNFVLSRGKDDAIVDPSPYGTQSSLTSNAPTVASGHLPKEYIPSQGYWGETTGWDWITQRKSGVIVGRCDYADQYKFQHRKSDVPEALRDFVALPSSDGTDVALVVIDRASTGGDDRPMNLRFRVRGDSLQLAGTTGEATVGGTKVTIANIAKSSGTPQLGHTNLKDCFKEGTVRGQCDAARFPVVDYRLELAGAEPRAIHVISLVDKGAKAPTSKAIDGTGWSGVSITGVRDSVVVWQTDKADKLSYTAPRGKAVTHVILEGPGTDTGRAITAAKSGDGCAVDVTANGKLAAKPTVFTLDEACVLVDDPEGASGAGSGARPALKAVRPSRGGCCGAEAAPGSSIAMTLVVGAFVGRRRRHRRH